MTAVGFGRAVGALTGVMLLLVSCNERIEVLRSVDGDPAGPVGGAPMTSGGGSGGGNATGGSDATGGSAGGESFSEVPLTGNSVVVDAGAAHSCAVVDGRLFCWGANAEGELGVGDVTDRDIATRVGSAGDWQTVSGGDSFSCALRAGGVWCFGSGSSGQLGNGTFASSLVPVQVSLPADAAQVVAGHEHACAILVDDRLFCWGANAEGQLAQDDPYPGPGVDSPDPVQVDPPSQWTEIAAGQGHGCGIKNDGTMHCWGRNTEGHLGIGSLDPGQVRVPLQVGEQTDWQAVAAGQSGTCGLRGTAELHCWGSNDASRLGVDVGDLSASPVAVPGMVDVLSFDTETFHSCAVTQADGLHCWGRNVEGQLGLGDTDDRSTPTLVVEPEVVWSQVATGRFHSCAAQRVDEMSPVTVVCTGRNAGGQLGVGDVDRRSVFSPVLVDEVDLQ